MYGSEAQFTEWIAIFGQDLIAIIEEYGIVETTTQTVIFNDLFPETEYAVVALPVDPDGNYGEYSYEIVTTSAGGGSDIIPDFTTTDIEGNEIHLYDILDAGQAVFINFFLYGDEYSETPMEDIIEAYHLYGCNTHDVFFMEITPNGTDANCQAWVERFGVEYPTISRDGGGNDIAQSIPVGFYPTLMLVRPDHTIAMRDIYPPTLEYIIDAFEGEGYMQYPCLEETLTFSTNTVNLNWAEMAWVTVYNNTAEDATITSICDDFYWLEFSLDGQDMFSCNFPVEFTIPQGVSVELGILCMVVGKSIVPDVVTISSNLPDAHFTVMVDDTWSVAENEASFTLFPNPANDFVTLKGENLGTVRVYNALGQKMDEFEANGSELRINTAGYAEGVYVVKAGEKTLRFVVRH